MTHFSKLLILSINNLCVMTWKHEYNKKMYMKLYINTKFLVIKKLKRSDPYLSIQFHAILFFFVNLTHSFIQKSTIKTIQLYSHHFVRNLILYLRISIIWISLTRLVIRMAGWIEAGITQRTAAVYGTRRPPQIALISLSPDGHSRPWHNSRTGRKASKRQV